MRNLQSIAFNALVVLLFITPLSSWAESGKRNPEKAVKILLKEIKQIVEGEKLLEDQKAENKKHSDTALGILKIPEISQKVLGKYWRKYNSKQRNQFQKLLGDLFVYVAFPSSAKFFSDLDLIYGKSKRKKDTVLVPFTVIHKKDLYTPSLKNEISMYLDNTWYSLIFNQKKSTSISSSLDPSILSNNILKPILNIIDERTDNNISFLDGRVPLSEIQQKIDNDEYAVAFILKPISITSIKEVADNNEILPPKSTYVEPKLRSGLTIYPIK